jgi:hypothetical protein
LKRDLNAWLENVGWTGGLPLGWQFLQVDTPTAQDGAEIKSAPMLAPDEYLGLVASGTTFDDIDQSLMANPQHLSEFSSWRVKPEGLEVPVHTGAGMYRAVGRSVAVAYLGAIRSRLVTSFSRLNLPESQASLSALYRHVHQEDPAIQPTAPIVVVVSSLAGGTGAGLINDVCDLLREMDPVAGGASFGLLYTPEVFAEIEAEDKGGIQPNSLAAICEVLNGYWWNGGSGNGVASVPKKNSQLMRSAGAVASYSKTGPAFPFLVGAQNSAGITYRESEQLFEVVGAALTSWATDITVQNRLLAYTYANWRQRAQYASVANVSTLVNQGAAGENEAGMNPFSAMGFSRVSVGNRYFERYAAERLAREAVTFLRHNHDMGAFAESVRRQQPNVSSKELVDRQCSEQFNWFLNLCRLDEKGPTSNQVQDAISPPQHEWTQIFSECLAQTVEWAQQEKGNVNDWMNTIEPAIENAAVMFDTRCEPIIDRQLLDWIENHPKVVTNAVVQAIGQFGLRVSEALVARLIREITDPNEGIISDIQREIVDYSGWAVKSAWSGRARAMFPNATEKYTNQSPVVEEACSEGLTNAICTTWVRVKSLTIELLNQFAMGFLEPLRQTLSSAVYSLDNTGGVVESWPTWTAPGLPGSLSSSSTPPMSEWTLIKPETFPALFDDLLARTVGGSQAERETHRVAARLATVCGGFIDEQIVAVPANAGRLQSLRLINHTNEWWPGVAVVRNSHKPPTIASFSMGVEVETIRGRAEQWLRQPGSPFARLLQDSLRTFTAPPGGTNAPNVSDQDYELRRQDFLSAFESAISASKPLVGLDTQLMAFLFGSNNHPRLAVEVSSVPFTDHPLYNSVRTRLQTELENLPGNQDAGDLFTMDSRANHIDIITSLYGAYPVLVIESLLKPIAQAWNSITDVQGREAFWDKRRARRLVEFIPAPQEHILCMLRGWFIGHALGLIHRENRSQPWSVAPRQDSHGRYAKTLPAMTLSTSQAWGDQPALVLESLGLAYVEVGVENNLEPLGGYVHLLELGKEGNGLSSGLAVYRTVSDYVVNWARHGKVSTAAGFEPHRGPRVKIDAQSPEFQDRIRALIDHFESRRSRYARELTEYERRVMEARDDLGRAPLWPSLHGPIRAALTQLIGSLTALLSGSDAVDSDDDDE